MKAGSALLLIAVCVLIFVIVYNGTLLFLMRRSERKRERR